MVAKRKPKTIVKTHEEDPLLSMREAGQMIGKHHTTIARWCRDGLLEFVKFPSGAIKIRRSRMLAMLKDTLLEIK